MTRRKTNRTPKRTLPVLLNAGGVVLALLLLSVAMREGAATVPFRRDTAWMPSAFGTVAVVGAVAVLMWFVVFAPASATSLRRKPPQQRQLLAYLATVVGLLFVVAGFWLAAADALRAITPLPLPWFRLASAVTLPIMFAAATIQANLLPPAASWDAHRLGLREINLVLLLSIPALLLLPGGATHWAETLRIPPVSGDGVIGLLGSSPGAMPWLTSVVATGIALFIGQNALYALRRPGAAMMVFAAVIFYQATANFFFMQASGATGLDATAHFLAILAAVVMDVVYMIRIYAAEDRRTLWLALAMGIVIVAGTTLILLPRPAEGHLTTVATVAGALVGGAALGFWCGWSGAEFGRWMRVISPHLD